MFAQPFSNAQGHPGSTLRRGSATGLIRGSIGYRVRLGSSDFGFITAAHGVTTGEHLYANGRRVGQVVVRHMASDSAFVRLSSGSSMSDRNPSASHLVVSSRLHGNLRVGDVVTRISQGGRDHNIATHPNHPIASSGRITITEYTIVLSVGNVVVHQASFPSLPGDSGGIVVTPDGTGSTQLIAGITVARRGDSLSYFVLASRINAAHGVTLH